LNETPFRLGEVVSFWDLAHSFGPLA
jgi:hypothetical protein